MLRLRATVWTSGSRSFTFRVTLRNVYENGIFFVEVNIAIILMYNNENRIKHLQINRMLLAAFIF